MNMNHVEMERQLSYELSLSWLRRLLEEGIISRKEYSVSISGITEKYNPIIKHNPLLIKEIEG